MQFFIKTRQTERGSVSALDAAYDPYPLQYQPQGGAYYSGARIAHGRGARLTATVAALLRLVMPVTLLLILLGAAYLFSDDYIAPDLLPAFAHAVPLTFGDLLLPLMWLSLHLTNRCYGAEYASAQLLLTLLAAAGIVLFNPYGIDSWLTPALALRPMLAFAGAFIFASLAAIQVFDGARGPVWWSAPLAASFAAALLFSALYYPAALAGWDAVWLDQAMVHFALFFTESVFLLFAYYLMRPLMPPLNGLNGY